MNYVNEFVIKGKALIIRNEGYSSIRLLSKSGKIDTYPLIQCSPKLLQKADIKPGMHIEVTGDIRVYQKRDPNGHYSRRQYLFATDIKAASTMCKDKFDIKGNFFNEMSTRVYLSGKYVSSSVRSDGWMSIDIKVSDSGLDVVRVNMKKLSRQPVFKKGDPICVVATVSTVNKEFGDKKIHFENIVVNDIGKPDA